jgi:FlaA1/EpsC-like NDP-sugar epimerase
MRIMMAKTNSDRQSSVKAESILVTGATATVGSEVVKQLSNAGERKIKAAVHSSGRVKRVEYDLVEPIQIVSQP